MVGEDTNNLVKARAMAEGGKTRKLLSYTRYLSKYTKGSWTKNIKKLKAYVMPKLANDKRSEEFEGRSFMQLIVLPKRQS